MQMLKCVAILKKDQARIKRIIADPESDPKHVKQANIIVDLAYIEHRNSHALNQYGAIRDSEDSAAAREEWSQAGRSDYQQLDSN